MRAFILAIAVLGFAGMAQAEDEFGARFTDQTPPGLETPQPAADALLEPQDVEPAAGDEATTEQPMAVPLESEIENNAEETDNEIETSL